MTNEERLDGLYTSVCDLQERVDALESRATTDVTNRVHGLAWSTVRARLDPFEDGTSASMARMDALAVTIVNDVVRVIAEQRDPS